METGVCRVLTQSKYTRVINWLHAVLNYYIVVNYIIVVVKLRMLIENHKHLNAIFTSCTNNKNTKVIIWLGYLCLKKRNVVFWHITIF